MGVSVQKIQEKLRSGATHRGNAVGGEYQPPSPGLLTDHSSDDFIEAHSYLYESQSRTWGPFKTASSSCGVNLRETETRTWILIIR